MKSENKYIFSGIIIDPSMKYASLCVNHSHNLGDIIQQLAMEQFLPRIDLYLDRDNDLAKDPWPEGELGELEEGEQVLVILNGWFKYKYKGVVGFPPHPKIRPVFFGFHINGRRCPELMGEKALEYYRAHQPIGCRDQTTQDWMVSQGVEVLSENFCLTLTFPKRDLGDDGVEEAKGANKVIVSSRDLKLFEALPGEILSGTRGEVEVVDHVIRAKQGVMEKKKLAREMLDKYRDEAKLVVTTYLHAALPCLAMGIPTILFYPNSMDGVVEKEDQIRLALAERWIPVYRMSQIALGEVLWSPRSIEADLEKVKAEQIEQLMHLMT